MRILVVSQYFWPENFRINDLVSELTLRGNEVTVLTGLPNYPAGKIFEVYESNPQDYLNYEGAEVIRVSLYPRGSDNLRLALNYFSFALSATFLGLWKLRGRKFDIIVTCQLSPVTVGIPAAVIKKVKRIPMAMWVLDLWPESLVAMKVVKSRYLLNLAERLSAHIYRQCDLILVQSKSFIPLIRGRVKSNTSIHYFPSWAENIFHVSNTVPCQEIKSEDRFFNVMFAGNIGDAQDFPAIINAAELLKSNNQIRFLIVGDGRNAQWVMDEIKSRKLENVVMLGQHSLEKMPSFFKHANVLLLSLKDEPIFGMTIPGKLQSYLAAGFPCVAMMNGEGADLIESSGAGISCAAGDYTNLAKAVLTLSQKSSKELSDMGLNARKLSEREFDRKKLIDQLEVWIQVTIDERKQSWQELRARSVGKMKRAFDLIFAVLVGLALALPMLLVAVAILLSSKGPILYWSERVGRNNIIFRMPKFRSMMVGTPVVATHLLHNPHEHLSPIGAFIRKTSLDELPQIWCVFTGEMSFVGPRPALFNQIDLIELRKQLHVDNLLPGITGWAQVNGRDELTAADKVKFDLEYLNNQSIQFDLKILFLTVLKVLRREGISH